MQNLKKLLHRLLYNKTFLVILLGIIVAFFIFWATMTTLKGLNNFFANREFQFNRVIDVQFKVVLKPPVQIVTRKAREVLILPHSDKKEASSGVIKEVEAKETGPNTDLIFENLRKLESTSGTALSGHHIYCRNKGMWNEIGYDVAHKYCFNNIDEARAVIRNRFMKDLEETTFADALCTYNLGGQKNGLPYQNCLYYQDYMSL